ncbi:MAG: TM2 domain-containing protein [Paracoccus sp. (in: a-proteobacteria)]|nr:TM2 domain-containing protein [Paracoccus sp. (in: a-proteobacteria)]
MKGQILHIDQQTGDGVIRGADGRRYSFRQSDLLGSGEPAHNGVAVDFEPRGQLATEIFPDPGAPVRAGGVSSQKRMMAAILAFFLGVFGVHKFYLGKTTPGLVMLGATLLGWPLLFIPPMVVGLIALVEAIIYFTISDAEFESRYVYGDRGWL